MIHRLVRPGPPLAEFVDVLWAWEDAPAPHARERLLPFGTFELVVNLAEEGSRVWDDEGRGQRLSGASISGAQRKYFVIDAAAIRTVVGVHFRPGGALPFLGVPAGDLTDAHVSLLDLWGREAETLRERLLAAPSADARIALVEAALLARLRRPAPLRTPHPAVTWALAEIDRMPHAATVASVTSRLALDRRRFLPLFRDAVGLSPKRYCRIRRFQHALDHVQAGRRVNWLDVAHSSGYYDQAHFIRDFRAFSGLAPTDYVAQQGPYRNHVPIRD